MCGITAYVGEKEGAELILSSLKNLEYRGYDSSGIAYFDDGDINIVKSVGPIKNLEEKIWQKKIFSNIMMGHTRWATHGKPNEQNAHPHFSQNKNVCVVHNGIIENAEQMKKDLKDVYLYSQTDTEVFANALESFLNNNFSTENILKTLHKLTKETKGSYAFSVMIKGQSDKIFFAKQKSPLVLGIGENFCMLSSDESALKKETKKVVFLSDGDYGYIEKSSHKIFCNGKETKRKELHFDYSQKSINKKGFSTFLEKEISEGPFSVLNTLLHLENINTKKIEEAIKNAEHIFVVGCGTALHAGEVFAFLLEKEIGVFASTHFASEFRYKKPKLNKNSLCIFISQSGETADTLASATLAKHKCAKSIAITNVVNSRITKICDFILPTFAGVEVSVASTKAYVAQLAALYFLLTLFAKIYGKKLDFSVKNILNLCKNGKIESKMCEINALADVIKNEKSLFFVGRGLDYFLAKEGALKLKEITYIHCEAFAGGELKHGSLSLLDENSFVVCILTQKELLEKMLSGILEIEARGAKVVLFSCFEELKEKVFCFINLKKVQKSLMPLVAIRPLQELSIACSLKKGINPDMPRNLAKSVTVE